MKISDAQECVTKTCTKCGETKSINDFFRDKSKRDGLYSQCKACCYEKNKAYQKTDSYREKQNVWLFGKSCGKRVLQRSN